MTRDTQELLLVWKHPLNRSRFVVGHLWKDRDGYRFGYERELPNSLQEAIEAGFRPLDPFPVDNGQQTSKSLFPIFQRRLPPEWREDEYGKLGLVPDEDMEYLRKTGGRLPGDTLEFLEPLREDGAAREYTVEFPVAGWRHYQGEQAMGELVPGTALRLELERDNPYDTAAIQILSPSGVLLGYVPRVYAWYLDDSVDQDAYSAQVKDIGPVEDPQVRVIVHLRASAPAAGYRRVPEGLHVLCC